jgi:hypothetical protein
MILARGNLHLPASELVSAHAGPGQPSTNWLSSFEFTETLCQGFWSDREFPVATVLSPPAQVAVAVELYHQGQSLVDVETRLGCDPSTLWRTFAKAGVKMRDSQGRDR